MAYTLLGKLEKLEGQTTAADVSTDITPTGAAIVIPKGYHDGTKHVLADANLTAANIKVGVTIYGVTGTYTNDATAAVGDIKTGKTAYVNGSKLTGTLP